MTSGCPRTPRHASTPWASPTSRGEGTGRRRGSRSARAVRSVRRATPRVRRGRHPTGCPRWAAAGWSGDGPGGGCGGSVLVSGLPRAVPRGDPAGDVLDVGCGESAGVLFVDRTSEQVADQCGGGDVLGGRAASQLGVEFAV